jgi:hypothetical protein
MTKLQIPPGRTGADVSVAAPSEVDGRTVIPVFRQDVPTGLFTVDGDDVRWHPVVEPRAQLTRTAAAAGAVAGAATVAALVFRRAHPVRQITMGPGGWVSFKNCTGSTRVRARRDGHRPWWAHLLRAYRVEGT